MPNLSLFLILVLGLLTPKLAADSLVELPEPPPTRENLEDWMASRGFSNDAKSVKERVFSNEIHRVECRSPSRRVTMDGLELWLHDGIVADSNGVWTVASDDLKNIIDPLLNPLEALSKVKAGLIVLDAGHGGHDEGARGKKGSKEKERTLDIALKVEAILKTLGYEVLLTRSKDKFLELEDRTKFAGKAGAALFISIHLNKSSNPGARGIETYVLTAPQFRSSNDPHGVGDPKVYLGHKYLRASMALAGSVHRHLVQNNSMRDRGIKRARFVVLREAPCPAILLECGFLSNPEEEKLFAKSTFRDYIARRISNGIHHYMGQVNKAQIKERLLKD